MLLIKNIVFTLRHYKILEAYYPKGEFNVGRQKMAKMPEKASLILNPLTAAPGFVVENIYVLPGVPQIMEKMFLNVLQAIEERCSKKNANYQHQSL